MAISDWLNQFASVETFHSFNAYGDPSYNAAATFACRISRKHRRVLNQQGAEVTSNLYLTCEEQYTVRDRFTVGTDIRVPIAVKSIPDGEGFHHHSGVWL